MWVRTCPGCTQTPPHLYQDLYQGRETGGLWNQPGVEPAPWGCWWPPVEAVPRSGVPPVPLVGTGKGGPGFLLLIVIWQVSDFYRKVIRISFIRKNIFYKNNFYKKSYKHIECWKSFTQIPPIFYATESLFQTLNLYFNILNQLRDRHDIPLALKA